MRAELSGEVFSPPFSTARVCGTRKRSSRFRLREKRRECVSGWRYANVSKLIREGVVFLNFTFFDVFAFLTSKCSNLYTV